MMKKFLLVLALCVALCAVALAEEPVDMTDVIGHTEYRNHVRVDNGSDYEHDVNYEEYTVYTHASKGIVREEYVRNGSTPEDHDYNTAGTCTLCGHTCSHSLNNGVCTICGYACNHSFGSDGLCTICGYACNHSFGSGGVCTICGYVCSHNFDNGVCIYCGMKCTHDITNEYSKDVQWIWKDNGDGTCSHVRKETFRVTCCQCYQDLEDKIVETPKETFPHNYDNNACTRCGAANTCTHDKYVNEWGEGNSLHDGKPVDQTYHTYTVVREDFKTCTICGQMIPGSMVRTVLGTATERHTYMNGNNACVVCGYVSTCSHAQTHEKSWVNGGDSVSLDDYSHRRTGEKATRKICDICGVEEVSMHNGADSVVENHYFNGNNICVFCYHECQHPAADLQDEFTADNSKTTWTDNGNGTCTKTQVGTLKKVCTICGMTASENQNATQAEAPQAHVFSNGVCENCGAAQPAPVIPAVFVTATPAPKATPVPRMYYPQQSMHGIQVNQAADPVETMAQALDALDAAGSNVEVTIVGADQAMAAIALPAQEQQAFQQVSVKEKMLLTFTLLGLDDLVQDVMQNDPALLSAEAQQLRSAILDRLNQMTDAEKAALNRLLEQTFYKTTLLVDGVAVEYFTIDLKITENGQTRYERYGFRQTSTGWELNQLAIR